MGDCPPRYANAFPARCEKGCSFAVRAARRRHSGGGHRRLGLAWRRDKARSLVIFSWILFALVWISIGLNLASVVRQGHLWSEIKPIYGLVQRSLFAAWFTWCAGLGMLLFRAVPRAPD